jgi:hypothetical protein
MILALLPPRTLQVRIASKRRPLASPLFTVISFRIRTSAKCTRNPFRIRTSKTKDLKPFRIRTCAKTPRGRAHFALVAALRALCHNRRSYQRRKLCQRTARIFGTHDAA